MLLLGPVLALLVLLFTHHGRRWTATEVTVATAVVLGAAAVFGVLAQLLQVQFLPGRVDRAAPALPAGLSREQLEQWRDRLRSAVLAARVEQGGQLDQMVRRETLDINVKRIDTDSRRPRLRVGGRLLAWSEIKRPWDKSQGPPGDPRRWGSVRSKRPFRSAARPDGQGQTQDLWYLHFGGD